MPKLSLAILAPSFVNAVFIRGKKRSAKRYISISFGWNLFKFDRFCPVFHPMPRELCRALPRLVSADEEAPGSECEGRLDSIIKTFRENNLRLMQKIEECDRMRQI